MGIVEIRPASGVYDYASKYTKGMTEYLAPAPLDGATCEAVRGAAETAFAACGCRDYARVDFILDASGDPFLLEINTLPGMKETSLLPMSARCAGLDFTASGQGDGFARGGALPLEHRLTTPMSKDIEAMPETRTWRDIPQQVRPRAMSREGRRRVTLGRIPGRGGRGRAGRGGVGGLGDRRRSSGRTPPRFPIRPSPTASAALSSSRTASSTGTGSRRTLAIPSNATLMGLDLIKLRSRVLADAQVSSATIVRNFPDTLTVRISERSPVARLMAQSGGDAAPDASRLAGRGRVRGRGIRPRHGRIAALARRRQARAPRRGDRPHRRDGGRRRTSSPRRSSRRRTSTARGRSSRSRGWPRTARSRSMPAAG